MLPIIWLDEARRDLVQIIHYIASENPSAARRMKRLLEEAILPAAGHPYLYRRSERVAGLREVVAHPNYIILYRVAADHIEVVNLIHARREFPGSEP